MVTTTKPASEKQIGFIHSLLKSRDLPVSGKDAKESLVIERCFDVMGGKDISSAEASDCIDFLKPLPMVSKAPAQKAAGLDLTGLPLSMYAVVGGDGTTRFYEVVERKGGARYLNMLIGHPGDWKRIYLKMWEQRKVADIIAFNPKHAAKLFSERHGVCAKCLSPLSDKVSIAAGLGPDCRKAF